MITKIIVSSMNLYSYLSSSKLVSLSGQDCIILVEKGKFCIKEVGGFVLCETLSQSDSDFKTTYIKLRRLSDLLRSIEDQPVTLIFKEGTNYMHIQSISI